jgi:hypothetical protein
MTSSIWSKMKKAGKIGSRLTGGMQASAVA